MGMVFHARLIDVQTSNHKSRHARILELMFAHQSFGCLHINHSVVEDQTQKKSKNTREDNACQRTAQKEYTVTLL
jgi:hypothetical protein